MSSEFTPARLEQLLAAATLGPWRAHVSNTGHVWGVDDYVSREPHGSVEVAQVGAYRDKELLPWNKERWDADTALIALCPSLAARVIELEAENARLMALLRKIIAASNSDNSAHLHGQIAKARTALETPNAD